MISNPSVVNVLILADQSLLERFLKYMMSLDRNSSRDEIAFLSDMQYQVWP